MSTIVSLVYVPAGRWKFPSLVHMDHGSGDEELFRCIKLDIMPKNFFLTYPVDIVVRQVVNTMGGSSSITRGQNESTTKVSSLYISQWDDVRELTFFSVLSIDNSSIDRVD